MNYPRVCLLKDGGCFSPVASATSVPIPAADNLFTGTTELEFFDAQATVWSGNTIPSGVCIDNISSDDGNSITESTFVSSDGLPTDEC